MQTYDSEKETEDLSLAESKPVNRLSLIFWHIIKNQIVTKVMFYAMMALDVGFQLMIIYEIFVENLKVSSVYQIDTIINAIIFQQRDASLVNQNSQNQEITHQQTTYAPNFLQVETLVAFCIQSFMLISILLLCTIRINQKRINSMKPLFQLISIIFVIMRTIASTYLIMVVSSNLYRFKHTSSFADLILNIANIFLLLMLQYLQGKMFNLCIPNSNLPWSEISHIPLLCDTLQKVVLAFLYEFTLDFASTFVLITCLISITAYKIFYRLYRNFIFSDFHTYVCLTLDTFNCVFYILFIPTFIIQDEKFLIALAIGLPLLLFGTLLLLNNLYQNTIFGKFYAHSNEYHDIYKDIKLVNYLVLKEQSNDISRLEKIGQGYYMHLFQCDSHFERFQHKLTSNYIKKYKSKAKQQQQPFPSKEQYNSRLEGVTMLGFDQMPPSEDEKQNSDIIALESMNIKQGVNSRYATIFDKFEIKTGAKASGKGMKLGAKGKPFSKHQVLNQEIFKSQKMKSLGSQFTNASNDPNNTLSKLVISNDSFIDAKVVRSKKRIKNQSEPNYYKLLKKYIKHQMRQHYQRGSNVHHLVIIAMINWILQQSHNVYQAQMYLLKLEKMAMKKQFVERNQILLHIKTFRSQIEMMNNDNQFSKQIMNIQSIIESTKLQQKQEKRMTQLTEQVQKFWLEISGQKQTTNVYNLILQISEQFIELKRTYDQILEMQQDNTEAQVYYWMSYFYKYVIFKPEEQALQLQRLRNAQLNQKFQGKLIGQNELDSKAIFRTRIDFQNPMKITYANPKFCKLVGYNSDEIISLPIGQLMPTYIRQNHSQFIERFLITGSSKFINTPSKQLVVTRKGYIIPVNQILQINIVDPYNAYMTMERIQTLELITSDDSNECGIMLIDKDYNITEISEKIVSMIYLYSSDFRHHKELHAVSLSLEDLFSIQNNTLNENLANLCQKGMQDFEVKPRVEQILNLIQNDQINEYTVHDHQNVAQEVMELHNKEYVMRFYSFETSLKTLPPLTLVTLSASQQTSDYLVPSLTAENKKFSQFRQTGQLISGTVQYENNDGANADEQPRNKKVDAVSSSQMQHPFASGIDLSSQTSTSTSSQNTATRLSEQTQLIQDSKIPTTLKFILQLMVLLIVIAVATGTVQTNLTVQNFNQTQKGIQMSQLYLNRQSFISRARLLVRQIINIGQGYAPQSNRLLPKRIDFYLDLLNQTIEELRVQQNQIDTLESTISHDKIFINVYFLGQDNQEIVMSQTLSESTLRYAGYGNDLIFDAQAQGIGIFKSDLPYFSLKTQQVKSATQIERKAFYMLRNGNQYMYRKLADYAYSYVQDQIQTIQTKQDFQQILVWVCLGVIVFTTLIILPMFGKIQDRIVQLMRIFYSLDIRVVQEYLNSITQFLIFIEANETQRRQAKLEERMERFLLHPDGYNSTDKPIQDQSGLGSLNTSGFSNSQAMRSSLFQKIHKRRELLKDSENSKAESDQDRRLKDMKSEESKLDGKEFEIIEEEESSESQSEGKEDQANHDSKKQKRKRRKTKKQESLASSNETIAKAKQQSQEKLAVISEKIKKHKIIQSLVMMTLCGIMCGYFLGAYYLSTKYLEDMQSGLQSLQIINYRQVMSENIIHAISEKLMNNLPGPFLVVNSSALNTTEDIVEFTMRVATRYENYFITQISHTRPAFLPNALQFLDIMEKGTYCPIFYSTANQTGPDTNTVTAVDCEQSMDGIALTGVTNIYQSIYKQVNQLSITFGSLILKYPQGIPDQLLLPIYDVIVPYLDVVEAILYEPNNHFVDLAQQDILDNISKEMGIFLTIFGVFISVTIIGFAIFLLYVFRKQKREMLLQNKVIYIIDFDMLKDFQKDLIQQFLNKF